MSWDLSWASMRDCAEINLSDKDTEHFGITIMKPSATFGLLTPTITMVMALMILASGCKTVSQPPPAEVQRITNQHRPKNASAGPVTLTRDDFTQAELKTLDEFLESRAGKRLGQPFTSMTVSPCGECRTHEAKGDGHDARGRGIWLNISGMRFCIPCDETP